MGLSGFVESGRFSGGQRSNINQTCSLLNQYLKKKGNFEDLNLGFNRSFAESDGAPAKTMDFLPMIENAGKRPEADRIAANSEPEKAQLTIFYAGQVIVFDDFPADKVDEIMALANGGNTNKNFTCTNTTMVQTAPNMGTTPAAATVAPNFAINMVQDNHSPMSLTKINDLPIARKNSLARFLEKRKDRIIASSPYQRNNKGDATSKAGPESKKSMGF